MSTATLAPPATLTVRDVFTYDSFTRPGVLITRVEALCGTLLTDRYAGIREDVLTEEHLDTDLLAPLPFENVRPLPLNTPHTTADVPATTWFSAVVLCPLLRSGLTVRGLPNSRLGVHVPLPLYSGDIHVGYVQPADPTRPAVTRRADGRAPGLCTLAEAQEVVHGARRRLTAKGWNDRLNRHLGE